MADLDVVAVATAKAGFRYHAVADGINGRSGWRCVVRTEVRLITPVDRMEAALRIARRYARVFQWSAKERFAQTVAFFVVVLRALTVRREVERVVVLAEVVETSREDLLDTDLLAVDLALFKDAFEAVILLDAIEVDRPGVDIREAVGKLGVGTGVDERLVERVGDDTTDRTLHEINRALGGLSARLAVKIEHHVPNRILAVNQVARPALVLVETKFLSRAYSSDVKHVARGVDQLQDVVIWDIEVCHDRGEGLTAFDLALGDFEAFSFQAKFVEYDFRLWRIDGEGRLLNRLIGFQDEGVDTDGGEECDDGDQRAHAPRAEKHGDSRLNGEG